MILSCGFCWRLVRFFLDTLALVAAGLGTVMATTGDELSSERDGFAFGVFYELRLSLEEGISVEI